MVNPVNFMARVLIIADNYQGARLADPINMPDARRNGSTNEKLRYR
jgi:hypothetical protein